MGYHQYSNISGSSILLNGWNRLNGLKACKLFILRSLEMCDLTNDIFEPVAKRISERVSSLSEIRRLCNNCGIEGWLKVEAVYALSGMVRSVNNRGPDLTLTNGTKIELKGMTNFDAVSIQNGCANYGVPCLFLADGSNQERVNEIENEEVRVIASRIIREESGNWIVGLAKPIGK